MEPHDQLCLSACLLQRLSGKLVQLSRSENVMTFVQGRAGRRDSGDPQDIEEVGLHY